jgi:tripartite-type tricarboxylate transporter receptor subunit TctC
VVVENRPGSGTLVGTDAAARAAPDGYTLLMGSVSNIALNMGLYQKLSYDSLRDFESVGLAVSYGYTLVARRDLPFGSLRELIAHARANPDKLTYASAGNGAANHLAMELFKSMAGVNLSHVPYKGAPQAVADVLVRSVPVAMLTAASALPKASLARVPKALPNSLRTF